MKRKITLKNPKGSGRNPMFKGVYGKSKRISISIPAKKESEIKGKISVILEPYLYDTLI